MIIITEKFLQSSSDSDVSMNAANFILTYQFLLERLHCCKANCFKLMTVERSVADEVIAPMRKKINVPDLVHDENAFALSLNKNASGDVAWNVLSPQFTRNDFFAILQFFQPSATTAAWTQSLLDRPTLLHSDFASVTHVAIVNADVITAEMTVNADDAVYTCDSVGAFVFDTLAIRAFKTLNGRVAIWNPVASNYLTVPQSPALLEIGQRWKLGRAAVYELQQLLGDKKLDLSQSATANKAQPVRAVPKKQRWHAVTRRGRYRHASDDESTAWHHPWLKLAFVNSLSPKTIAAAISYANRHKALYQPHLLFRADKMSTRGLVHVLSSDSRNLAVVAHLCAYCTFTQTPAALTSALEDGVVKRIKMLHAASEEYVLQETDKLQHQPRSDKELKYALSQYSIHEKSGLPIMPVAPFPLLGTTIGNYARSETVTQSERQAICDATGQFKLLAQIGPLLNVDSFLTNNTDKFATLYTTYQMKKLLCPCVDLRAAVQEEYRNIQTDDRYDVTRVVPTLHLHDFLRRWQQVHASTAAKDLKQKVFNLAELCYKAKVAVQKNLIDKFVSAVRLKKIQSVAGPHSEQAVAAVTQNFSLALAATICAHYLKAQESTAALLPLLQFNLSATIYYEAVFKELARHEHASVALQNINVDAFPDINQCFENFKALEKLC